MAAPSLAWLFVGRAVAGVGGATIGPASAALADVAPPERRGAIFGLVGAAYGIGFVIGPAVGGPASSIGGRAPFLVAAGTAALNAAMVYLALPETLAPSNRRPFRLSDANVFCSFRPLLVVGHAAPLLLAWFLWQVGVIVYPATWAFWATMTFGWDAAAIGWSLAYVGLLSAFVQVVVTGPAIRRFGERRGACRKLPPFTGR